jgi:hypothetical protein
MMQCFATRRFTRGRWRAWLAAYVLLALVWPAIGPLPWLIDFAPDEHRVDRSISHETPDAHAGSHSHHDASEIPGSPTHPDDHDCFQCQVIKHLARCVPSACVYPIVALAAGSFPKPPIVAESIHAAFAVPRPPIRGPPLLDV